MTAAEHLAGVTLTYVNREPSGPPCGRRVWRYVRKSAMWLGIAKQLLMQWWRCHHGPVHNAPCKVGYFDCVTPNSGIIAPQVLTPLVIAPVLRAEWLALACLLLLGCNWPCIATGWCTAAAQCLMKLRIPASMDDNLQQSFESSLEVLCCLNADGDCSHSSDSNHKLLVWSGVRSEQGPQPANVLTCL